MARESALWARVRKGGKDLAAMGHRVDLQRLENAIGTGHPDIEGCVDGAQVWIELKRCDRPVRDTTKVRPKVRDSQRDWHAARTAAGSRCHWVLIQVDELYPASLYLIPGYFYESIIDTEKALEKLSFCDPKAGMTEVLLKARWGW